MDTAIRPAMSLLVAIARVLASVARKGETLARIGGDEFVLLMPDAGGDAPPAVARRMREAVEGLNLDHGTRRDQRRLGNW